MKQTSPDVGLSVAAAITYWVYENGLHWLAGCSIVITLLAACVRLWINYKELQKHK